MNAKIKPEFWSDSDIESLSPESKLATIWLMTNSDIVGICNLSQKRFSYDTGLDPEALERAIKALPRAFVRTPKGIWSRNFIRHQFGDGESLRRNNLFRAILQELADYGCGELTQLVADEYDCIKTILTHGSCKGSQALTKNKGEGVGEGEGVQGVLGGAALDSAAEAVYGVYPRKVGKPAAIRAIAKAIQRDGYDPVIDAARKFAVCWEGRKDMEFCPHPATWFNQSRYNDDPSTWRRNGDPQPAQAPAQTSIWEKKQQIEIIKQQISELEETRGYPGPFGWEPNTELDRINRAELKRKLKDLERQIVEVKSP